MNTEPTTPTKADQQTLDALLEHFPALVLTGAGISVGAGIPTYRDRHGTWLRSDPITHQAFVSDARARQRYWGRSILGWPAVRDARPAGAHRSLASLEQRGLITHLVTQNVDRLHQRAGSQQVTDLHGRLDRVICLDCPATVCREHLQLRLQRTNPHVRSSSVETRPDGDADLADDIVASIQIPACEQCGGTLMPDVVFFGGSIPRVRVEDSQAALKRAHSLVVIGSSLQVYSGFRFCRWATEFGKPIIIVNPGTTRADSLAHMKIADGADSLLGALVDRLSVKVMGDVALRQRDTLRR